MDYQLGRLRQVGGGVGWAVAVEEVARLDLGQCP